MAEDAVNRTFRMLVEEQKRTTAAIRAVAQTNNENTDDREKSELRIEAGKKAWRTRQENIAKAELAAAQKANQPKPVSAAQEEANNEQRNYLTETFNKFLGKDSFVARGLGSIGESLMTKVKGGIDSLFGLLKTGAFLASLLAVSKFLQSQLWQDILDKYIPILGDALQSLFNTLKKVVDGFFVKGENGKYTFSATAGLSNIMSMISTAFTDWIKSLKDGFYDENGDFTLTGGIKNLAADFAGILTALAGFSLLLAPRLFFGTLYQVGRGTAGLGVKILKTISGKFGALFTNLGSLGTSLLDTNKGFRDKVNTSKKTGVFRKGLQGLTGRFGSLFRFLGKRGLVGLLVGAGVGMASLLDFEKTKGLFSDTAKGISSVFKTLFSPLKTFATTMADIAAKATVKLSGMASEAAVKLGLKAVTSPTAKLTPKQLDALRGTGEFAFKPKPAIPTTGGRGTVVEKAGERAKYLSELSSSVKIATTAGETVTKSIVKSGLKKLPLISIPAGMLFGVQRLTEGEYHKAYLEVLSGILGTAGYFSFGGGTAGSIAIDAGLLASDLGISVDDAKKLIIQGGGTVANGTLPKSNSYTNSSSRRSGDGPNGGGFVMAPNVVTTNNLQDQTFSFGNRLTPDPFTEGIITIQ
tara:strand:+ start:534 stop:2450 length:1917 start_codon:yes stop_codon:yes gene_type:complete